MITDELIISRNIKSFRVKKGYSQEETAILLKVSDRTYKKIENHPLGYSINLLNNLAEILGCNIDQFFLPN